MDMCMNVHNHIRRYAHTRTRAHAYGQNSTHAWAFLVAHKRAQAHALAHMQARTHTHAFAATALQCRLQYVRACTREHRCTLDSSSPHKCFTRAFLMQRFTCSISVSLFALVTREQMMDWFVDECEMRAAAVRDLEEQDEVRSRKTMHASLAFNLCVLFLVFASLANGP
eukprot:6175485-Pleurochrysis_carterae.AAC.1